ncbi:MAG TPA: sulfatase-like hydrolase/transferase [Tepidisphaeraceae bacterium]|nr:sulfatase-like hydrolase/transferase [Tepidisphaeraceae bacterium]
MHTLRRFLRALLILFIATPIFAAEKKPNILFILCDDLGYGDVGVFFQNARAKDGKPAFTTKNIDAVAADGLILRQHYCAAPVCAPSRASLMTGQSQGHCAIRDNQFDKPLPDDVLTMPQMLKQAGYHTGIIGKWGLGGHKKSNWPAHPLKRGFDEFFGFMLHGTGHVYYHDAEHPLMENMTDLGAKYENVYSTDLFTARAKKFITDHESSHPDQPFFLYLAYTAVHNKLNVPGNAYPKGGGKTGGLQWPLQPTPQTRDKWIYPEYAKQSWNDDMKRYATMARRLDDGIGDLRQLLADLKIDRDTLVIFTSDNGPANEGGADPRLFSSWGPFDGLKRDVFEGGVREPTIALWPGQIKPGRTSDLPSAQYDWMPTFAELTKLPIPAQTDGVSLLPTLLETGTQREHPYIYVEYFHNGANKASKDVFARKGVTGRGQQQFVRIGDFAGVRTQIKSADDPLRLYDVMRDPHEDHNLAKDPSHVDLLERMKAILISARIPDSDAPRPYDKAPMPAIKREHLVNGELALATFEGEWPWTPDFTMLKPISTTTAKAITAQQAQDRPYGLQFTGYLSIPTDGEYIFTATSDHGVHLWLHDAHVIDSDAGANKPIAAGVRLKAGLHPIRVAYAHQSGAGNLSLRFAGPGLIEQNIPATALARDETK